jgi:hypothetical protein
MRKCKTCGYEYEKFCNACKVRRQRDRVRKSGRMKVVFGSVFEKYIAAGDEKKMRST